MKKILIGCALFLGTSTAFSQEISSKEKKGDKHYFLYNYDEAVAAYNSSKTLSLQAHRRLAESHAKMGNLKDAEVGYSYLVNNQSAVIKEDYFNYAMVLKSASRDDDYALWMNKFASVAPMDLRAKSYVVNSPDYQKLSTDTKKYKIKSLEMNSQSLFSVVFDIYAERQKSKASLHSREEVFFSLSCNCFLVLIFY